MNQEDVVLTIKKAARDLFRKYGYNKTSVNELAKQARISKATFYKIFPSKELILHEVLMDYIRENVEDILNTPTKDLDLSVFLGKTSLLAGNLFENLPMRKSS